MNRRSWVGVRLVGVALLLPLVAAATSPEAEEVQQLEVVEDDTAASDDAEDGEDAAITAVPAVTLRPGPTSELHHLAECNDVLESHEAATSVVVLERSDGVEDPLEVAITEVGPAMPGEDHEALPASMTFPAGADEVTLTVTPLAADEGRIVELEVRLVAGDGYEVGEPHRARLVFLRPKAADAPPKECGFGFLEGPELTRDVVVGGRPDDILVGASLPPGDLSPLPPDRYRVQVLDGALPPGLTLATDGTFGGAATDPGRTVATIEACRTEAPGTCRTAELTITVAAAAVATSTSTPSSPDQLPATGALPAGLLVLGAMQLGVGTTLLRSVRRASSVTPPRGSATS